MAEWPSERPRHLLTTVTKPVVAVGVSLNGKAAGGVSTADSVDGAQAGVWADPYLSLLD